MINTMDIVSHARDCIGTPVHHMGRHKGFALDCAGLILHVVNKVGYKMEGYEDPPYRKVPSWVYLKGVCDKHFQKVWHNEETQMPFRPYLKNGDILLLSLRRYPIHMGFAAVDLRGWNMVHAFYEVGKVCEHRIDEEWEKRVKAVYRIPGSD